MNADDTLLYMHSLHLACFLLEEHGCKLSVTAANFALWDFISSSSKPENLLLSFSGAQVSTKCVSIAVLPATSTPSLKIATAR